MSVELDQRADSVTGAVEQLTPAALIFTPIRLALLMLTAFQVHGSPLALTVEQSGWPSVEKLTLVIVAVSSLFVWPASSMLQVKGDFD